MEEKPKVLVVDDHKSICESIAKILTRKGYSVDSALDAETALRKIKESKFALIIVDVMMPKIGGIEILKTIRREYKESNVIMITGYPSIPTAVEATKSGAMDYIPKPFTPDELFTVVNKVLEEKKHPETVFPKKLVWYYEKNNHVLVVDDEAVICTSVQKILASDGYHVECAHSTDEAIEKFNQNRYALTLLDLRMPRIGGIELLRQIKNVWPDTRVIIITGYASIESAVEATKLGAISYLQKPFTPQELRKVVNDAIALKQPENFSK